MTLLLTCLVALQADAVRDAAERAQKVTLNAELVWQRTADGEPHAPVLVSIDNPGGEIRGELLLGWGIAATLRSGGGRKEPITPRVIEHPSVRMDLLVPKASRRRHFVYVHGRYPSPQEELWVLLMADGKVVSSFSAPQISRPGVIDAPPRVGIVGNSGLPGLASTRADTPLVRTDQLPDHWFGYRPLLGLVWTDGDPANLYDPSQFEALRRWTASGGHLVIARGDAAGLKGTFLEKVAPVTIEGGSVPCGDWSGLGGLVRAPAPKGGGALLPVRARGTASVLARSGEHPLVVQGDYGRGRVTFLSFDPTLAPFSSWKASPAFWVNLLDIPPPPPKNVSQVIRTTYGNIVGNGRTAALLSHHAGVKPPSISWALLLILIYVFLVGPIDFLLLRRLRKMELTWITFPCCVVLFSSITLLSGASITTQRPLYHETQVIDVHPRIGVVRGHAFGSLLTLTSETYEVTATDQDAVLSTFNEGSPGHPGSRVAPRRILDWNIPRGDTGTLVSEWCAKESPITITSRTDTRLTVRNDTNLTLDSAWFVDGDRIHQLSPVPPGTTEIPLGKGMPARGNGFTRAGLVRRPSQDPNEYNNYSWQYGYRSENKEQLRRQVRLDLGYFSFRGILMQDFHDGNSDARVGGLMRDLDASRWIRSGGACLLGWTSGPSRVTLEGPATDSYTDTLVRVFVR